MRRQDAPLLRQADGAQPQLFAGPGVVDFGGAPTGDAALRPGPSDEQRVVGLRVLAGVADPPVDTLPKLTKILAADGPATSAALAAYAAAPRPRS